MKLAVIPPYCFSTMMCLQDYQLLLPQCFHSEEYTRVAYAFSRDPKFNDTYVMLDNGAAEGEAWHPQALIVIGREFEVDEIVVPDILADYHGTLDMLEWFQNETSETDRRGFGWMGVLQGTNMSQLLSCAEAYAETDFISSFGIPRHLLETVGDKHIRLFLANELFKRYGDDYDMHFLGMNPSWYMEPKVLAAGAPYARGIDTSLPFVSAYHDVDIEEPGAPLVSRPEHYFEANPWEFSNLRFEQALRVLKGWCNG